MRPTRRSALSLIVGAAAAPVVGRHASAATSLDQLVDKARGEKTINFIASAGTWGGHEGCSALQDAFNKKFGLDARIVFTPGPSMPAMAARLLAEFKANRPASCDVYIGPYSSFALLGREKVLESVDWSGTFPWISKEMELAPGGIGVLVRSGPNGILYNPKFIPPAKAPKTYEDLVDPDLSKAWVGKLAIPAYPDWLTQLALLWGFERVEQFATKIFALASGQMRYGDAEPIVNGQFPILACEGAVTELVSTWADKGVQLIPVFGSDPAIVDYFQLGVPGNAASPNLAKLFSGWAISLEAQLIMEKYSYMASHMVKGTRLAKYLAENNVRLEDPKALWDLQTSPAGVAFAAKMAKMMRR